MSINENSIFIENLQVQNTHSFNNPLVDVNERIPLDKQEVWIDRSLIPSIPPLPDVFPGGAISGPVRGISGVLLTSLNSSPRQFKYQGTGTQQFANMVPASYFNNAYRPTLRDFKGKVVPYNPNVWVADGLLSIVEFKSDTPVSLGYSPPFTIDYWQYIGPTASSWSSGGNVELENLGTGTQIYNSITASGLRSITTGSGLTAEVTPDSEMINFENTLTATNKGNGTGIFINKTDNNLNFRSLLSSENNITFVGNSDNIDININTIPLVKLANIPANTIIGNNTLLPSDPKALDAGQVKSLLSLDEVANININTWNGSTFINTLGTINTLNVGTLNVSSAISSTGIDSNLTLKATGTGIINCESNISSSSLACDTISPRVQSTPKPLILSGLTNGGVEIRDTSLSLKSQLLNSNSDLNIDGLTSTNSRQIICKQNNVSQCSFGISGTSNFFVKDLSTTPSVNLLELTLGTANRTSALKLPTYTSNGMLKIINGTVSVDTNFTTSTNTINVDNITAITANSNLTLNANGNGAIDCGAFNLKTNTILPSATSGDLTLNAAGSGAINCGAFNLKTNTILPSTAGDLTLNATGSGAINCGAFNLKTNKILASTTDSNLTLNANGNGAIDCEAFNLKANTILPSTASDLTLNAAGSGAINCGAFNLKTNKILPNTTSGDLTLNAAGTGAINCGTFNLKTNTILPSTSGDLTLNAAGSGAINCGAFNLKTNTILPSTAGDLTLNSNGANTFINCNGIRLGSDTISSIGSLGGNLRLSANEAGFIICDSKLRVSNITNNGPISINANQGFSDVIMACPLNMSTNSIGNATNITSQTITCDNITASGISSNSLILKGINNSGIETQDPFIKINNKVVDSDSIFIIDGLTTTKFRQIICKQNNVSQCSFGLSGTSNFFVKDLSTNPTVNLLELTLGTADRTSALKLPTYTSNGLLRIDSGTVTVDTIVSSTSNSLNIKTTAASVDSDLNIDGATTTKSRQIICKQNNLARCSFGLLGSSNFFVKDLSTIPAINLLELTLGTANRASALKLPTYTSNGLLRIDSGIVTVDSNFTTSSNTINVDTVRAKTTNSNLTLNGNGTGTVNTNAPYIYIANNRIDTDTSISLDGTTVTKSRYVACYQNAVHKLGFGLAASSYFFIWDNVNERDLFQASIITGNIRFPTYSTNGILRIDSGDVSVDTNFTTSSNTINVDTVRAKTTNSDLFLHPNGTGTVVTNSPVIYIASNRVDTDSRFSIDGPTITNGRYIACYQNGFYKLGFGLQSSTHFFIWDHVNGRDLFQANISDGKIRFPTYTNGILRITDGTVAVDSNFTTSSNNINCNSITSNSTVLLLNGTGSNFANVSTNNASFLVSSNVANQESFIGIDGPTTTYNRHIACYQNGIYRCSFGLSGVQYFYVSDTVAALELFKVNMGGGNNCIRFPTYSNNGILRIDNGVVTVDTNFTTSTNTINCYSIKSPVPTLLLNGTGSDYANVVTENASFYIASNVANHDSYVGIDGPTTTKGRFIACYQSNTLICKFGIQSTTHFYIYDLFYNKDYFRVYFGQSNPIQFPTYTTDGTAYFSNNNGTLIRTSDRRLKQNEELLNSAESLQQIMNLQPKKYCWKSDPNRVKIGFIAQDVELAIPEAIDGKKYEYEFVRDGAGPGVDGTVRVDENGNPVLDYNTPRYRGLDNCAIISVLVSAFQELTNRLNESNSKILNLTNQLAESESKVLDLNIRLLNLESKI